jgi:hypothetical protein
MAKARLGKKQKSTLFFVGLLLLLVVLGLFVFFYDKILWGDPNHQAAFGRPLEIMIILVGLAIDGVGGAFGLYHMWNGQPKSFIYDVGLRLLITGYLMAFIAAMADYLGVGGHHLLPYFGPLQAAGVYLGEVVIAAGFLMMFPYHKHNSK